MKEELLRQAEQFDRYYFVGPDSDYGDVMWQDIGLMENAVLLHAPLGKAGRLLRTLYHIHFSFVLNSRFTLPGQSLWKNRYALSALPFEDGERICVIYTDNSACRTDLPYLKSLREKKNVTMVLVMANVVERKKRLVTERLPCFDYVFTWDRADAEKYGFILHSTYYSRVAMPPAHQEKTDCFFVGCARGRLGVLTDLYRRITAAGGKAAFYVTEVPRKDRTEPGIRYNRRLPYSEVLARDMAANCIIEVVAGSQVGSTLRSEEAIIGNRKLLTNNAAMRENPYFETGFIRIFSEITEEDVDFVLRKEPVDYHYRNDYSPLRLIDRINALEAEKRQESTGHEA